MSYWIKYYSTKHWIWRIVNQFHHKINEFGNQIQRSWSGLQSSTVYKPDLMSFAISYPNQWVCQRDTSLHYKGQPPWTQQGMTCWWSPYNDASKKVSYTKICIRVWLEHYQMAPHHSSLSLIHSRWYLFFVSNHLRAVSCLSSVTFVDSWNWPLTFQNVYLSFILYLKV